MLSNSRFLFKTSLMGLVRFEKSAERKMKFHAVPAIVGFCCIILGYVLALDILRGDKSVWFSIGYTPIAMLTLVLVVVGTILFISSFLPFVVHISKNNKRKFYTETKIITSPNFIYRMRSNSKTLIMLTLLSAATLTVSSVMALSLYYPIAAVSRMAPSEIECRIENESEIDAIKQIVNEHSSKMMFHSCKRIFIKLHLLPNKFLWNIVQEALKAIQITKKFCEMQGLNVSLIQTI